MIEAQHNEVGIESINDGGLIFVRVGKVANVLENFMFAFARFAAGRNDDFRVGFKMRGNERVKFIHERGSRGDGTSIPNCRCVWVLIYCIRNFICIFTRFCCIIFIDAFLQIAGEPRLVATFALLVQFCNRCNAVKSNNNFFFRLKHVNISLYFIANGKNNFGFIYINIFCSDDSFVHGIINDAIAVCIKVINAGSKQGNFFENGWVAFDNV